LLCVRCLSEISRSPKIKIHRGDWLLGTFLAHCGSITYSALQYATATQCHHCSLSTTKERILSIWQPFVNMGLTGK
jgi:hypothetical protein